MNRSDSVEFFELPDSLIFKVSGKDALRYLNARLTNKIEGSCERAVLAAALTPTGKTEGLFIVVSQADSYLLCCDGGVPDEVRAALARYIVADQVDIEDISSAYSVVHVIRPQLASGQLSSRLMEKYQWCAEDGLIAVATQRTERLGIDYLVPEATISKFTDGLEAESAQQLTLQQQRVRRFKSGIPSFPEEINQQRLFLEASVVDAVCHRKGCYVGQEVVERISALGRLPRKLVPLCYKGEQDLNIEDEIFLCDQGGPKKIGGIVSLQKDEFGSVTYLFADLKNLDFDKAKLQIRGERLHLLNQV